MTNKELVNRLSEGLELSKSETRLILDDVVEELTEQLGHGNGFTLPQLGTFKTQVKEIQKIYNPHYKKYMLVPPKKVVVYSPAKSIKENLKFIEPENE